MVNRSFGESFRLVFIVLAILTFLTLFIVFSTGSFTITAIENKDIVYTAEVLSAECVARSDNLASFDLGSVPSEGAFYGCTTADAGKYIPVNRDIECEFSGSPGPLSQFTVYDCPSDVSEKSEVGDSCTKLFVGDTFRVFNIESGHKAFIDPGVVGTGLGGKLDLLVKYPSYGLRVESATGFVFPTTNSCELSSLSRDLHTIDVKDLTFVVPDAPFNVATGLSPAISSRVVLLDGDMVYIAGVNQYYDVFETDDGFLIVDLVSGKKFSDDIECIPGLGCSSDAKLVPLEGQDADAFGGVVLSDYAPVAGDPSKLCRYEVVNGVLVVTDDCIAVQNCNDANFPLWDTRTGECVKVLTTDDDLLSNNLLFWVVVGASFLLILSVMVIIRLNMDKSKSVRRRR